MIYDTFEVEGVCRGCGKPTKWYIDGSFPLCKSCMGLLIIDAKETMKNDV